MRLLTIIPLLSLVVTTGCSDVVKSSHATLAAAKADIEMGWIPPVLPASTVQIRESHNIDTNIGHGTFVFLASDADQFRSVLSVLPPGEPIRRIRIPREQMEQKGFNFYRHGDFYIAVNWSRSQGEFWLASSR